MTRLERWVRWAFKSVLVLSDDVTWDESWRLSLFDGWSNRFDSIDSRSDREWAGTPSTAGCLREGLEEEEGHKFFLLMMMMKESRQTWYPAKEHGLRVRRVRQHDLDFPSHPLCLVVVLDYRQIVTAVLGKYFGAIQYRELGTWRGPCGSVCLLIFVHLKSKWKAFCWCNRERNKNPYFSRRKTMLSWLRYHSVWLVNKQKKSW